MNTQNITDKGIKYRLAESLFPIVSVRVHPVQPIIVPAIYSTRD